MGAVRVAGARLRNQRGDSAGKSCGRETNSLRRCVDCRPIGNERHGDALISSKSGIVAGIRTADCLPILLVDPASRTVAAVHAGWRGTVQNITVRAVDEMSARFGTKRESLEVAIGPGIGLCCFEVGPEVAREFGPHPSDNKTYLDLQRINLEKLREAGIQKLYVASSCTFCGRKEFFSSKGRGKSRKNGFLRGNEIGVALFGYPYSKL